jgi:hypothetical protein
MEPGFLSCIQGSARSFAVRRGLAPSGQSHDERPIGPYRKADRITVSLRDRRDHDLVNAVLWDEWAEMSISHRDVHDADVAAVLHRLQQEAEIERLRQEGRL